MTELENKILKHEFEYRDGKPTISDLEFDTLFETLPEDSVLRKKGIIAKVPSERKEKLPVPMFSMNKTKTIAELKEWVKSLDLDPEDLLIITGKYDGISLCTNESTGQAWTRGNGEIGQRSAVHFENMVSVNIASAGDRMTFGEAIMPKTLFTKYKEEFANPRNLVAGLFNTSEIRSSLNDVYYMRYGIDDKDLSKLDQLVYLNEYNPFPIQCTWYDVKTFLNESDEILEHFMDGVYQHISEVFEIDGLIIEVDDAAKRRAIGRERNNNPAYARALKLDIWQKGAEVTVLGITWEAGKQGELTPVIQVTPTNIGGVMVSNVTGYNARYVDNNSIGYGATIRIIRSGDVIPKHLETLTKPDDYYVQGDRLLPDTCPYCGSDIVWDENHVEILCSKPEECPEVRVKKIIYFFYKLGFENFGEGNVRRLYQEGLTTINQILCADWMGRIANFPGWGKSSASKVKSQIDKIFEEGLPAAQLMQAYDLFDGKTGAKVVQPIFDTIEPEHWFDVDMIATVPGVSHKTAKVFTDALERYDKLKKVIPVSFWVTPKVEPKGDAWAGASVCFSGVRNAELKEEIESQGGKIASGVSKNTTHLIVKDLSEKVLSSSKSVKAKSLGIPVIPIGDLL